MANCSHRSQYWSRYRRTDCCQRKCPAICTVRGYCWPPESSTIRNPRYICQRLLCRRVVLRIDFRWPLRNQWVFVGPRTFYLCCSFLGREQSRNAKLRSIVDRSYRQNFAQTRNTLRSFRATTSLRLQIHCPHHLAPLFDFARHERTELRRRCIHRLGTLIAQRVDQIVLRDR